MNLRRAIALFLMLVIDCTYVFGGSVEGRQAYRKGDFSAAAVAFGEGSDPVDAYFLALMNLKGEGRTADTRKGMAFLGLSADAGYSPAQYLLGLKHLYGVGTARNRKLAESCLLAAAADGDYRAVALLKIIDKESLGLKKDLELVAASVKKAARSGNPDAQSTLAFMYLTGDGVPKDAVQEVRWYRAASQKNARAAFVLSFMYQYGDVVAQSLPEAARLMHVSAELGDIRGQYFWGTFLYQGTGVASDKTKAADWFRLSAENGFSEAQFAYGMLLLSGEGVSQEKGKAIEWLTKASQQHNEKAREVLRELLTFRGAIAPLTGSAQGQGQAVSESRQESQVRMEGKGVILDQGRFGLKFSLPALADPYTPKSSLAGPSIWERLQGGTVDIIFRPVR